MHHIEVFFIVTAEEPSQQTVTDFLWDHNSLMAKRNTINLHRVVDTSLFIWVWNIKLSSFHTNPQAAASFEL